MKSQNIFLEEILSFQSGKIATSFCLNTVVVCVFLLIVSFDTLGQQVPKITFQGISLATPSAPTATTNPATNVASSSATLNGTVDPNESSTTAWFEWGTSNTLSTFATTISQSIGSGTAPVQVSDNLTGLSPNSTYYYRVVGQNSLGTQRGSIVGFTTNAYAQLTIRQIQQVSSDSLLQGLTTSYYVGDTVWVTGVVRIPPRDPRTGGTLLFTGDRFRLIIQDPNDPEWGSITVVSEDTALSKATNKIDTASEGDSISVLGVVDEFRTVTRINALRINTAFVIWGAGTILPPPQLPLSVFKNGVNPIWNDAEKYESVVVTMRDLTVLDISDPYFTVADAQGNQIHCDDESNELFNAYNAGNVPSPGTKIEAITGYMDVGSDLIWEFNPRSVSDIAISGVFPGEYHPDVNTVLLLHMNEISGSSVGDASSYGNNGVATGTTIANGKFGKARSFAGSGNFITINDSPSLRPSQVTVEAWVYSSAYKNMPWGIIASKERTSASFSYRLQMAGSTGRIYFGTGISQDDGIISVTELQDGKWYHIAGSFDGATLKVLINGVLEGSKIQPGSIPYNSDVLYLGRAIDIVPSEVGIWKGIIDEVRISNNARDPTEFNLQLPPKSLIGSASGTTVNLSWQNGGGLVGLLRYRIYRGADSTNVVLIDSTTSTSYSNTGLAASTRYFYRVSGVDITGFESVHSFASSASTGAAGSVPTVTTSSATSISSNSVTLNGTVNPNGLVTMAWFEWGTSSTLATYSSTAAQSIGSGTTAVSVTANLTGLSPNTTYYFRVAGQNSTGTQRGSIVSFSTLSTLLLGEYTPDPSTVLLLHLNETSGSTVSDASGNNNNGTMGSGVSTTPGARFGDALRFDGTTNASVNIPASSLITFGSGDFSAEVWMKTSSTAIAQWLLLRSTGTNKFWGLALGFAGPGGRPSAEFQGAAGLQVGIFSTIQVSDGNWHHIAVTRSSSLARLYVNGVQRSFVDLSTMGPTDTLAGNLFIGGASGNNFSGIIDEVRVSNKARFPREFNLQLPPKNVTAIATGTTIALNWQNGGGGTGLLKYRIYRGTDSTSVVLVDSTISTSYLNTNLAPNTRYFFRVAAVDSTGFESVKSDAAAASTTATFTEISSSLTGLYYSNVAWCDYDNDGKLDIMITGADDAGFDHFKIYRNDGQSFTEVATALPPGRRRPIALGDFDNDGNIDVLTCGSGGAEIYRNSGGNFTGISVSLPAIWDGAVAWGDCDNDGNLDFILAGSTINTGGNPVTKVFRNLISPVPVRSFVEVASLRGIYLGSVAWGDFDNDGEVDLVLTGLDSTSNPTAQIYRNDSGTFVPISSDIVGVREGSVAWGDYDGDGDLDLLIVGYSESGPIAKVYRNDGPSTGLRWNFVDITAPVQGITGVAVWGDYDNDGDLDILSTGSTGSIAITKLYRNDNGNFVDALISITGGSASSAAWGDYDSDGDLDLLVAGQSGSLVPFTTLYKNNVAFANSIPAIPTGLASAVESTSVALSWNKSNDDETPQNGLTYNIRVGTTPNGVQIVSPLSNALGFRRIPRQGNVYHKTSWKLKSLTAGTYYWSVQAIDNAFAGSPFAPEHTFTVGGIPTTITLTSGNNQTGNVGTTLPNPLGVTVTDAAGNPVQGVGVTFAIASTPAGATGQSLTVTNTSTNSIGEASTVLTLGDKVGTYTVTATSTGLNGSPLTFTATATAGLATTISLASGNNQSGNINTTLANPFVVRVTDAGGNPVSGVNVTFAVASSPSGASGQALSVTNTSTNSIGEASTVLTLGDKVGTYTITASSAGLSGSPVTFTATATGGTATTISLASGNDQSGNINTILPNPFVVTVTDAGGNAVQGVGVTFSVASAPAGATGHSVSVINTPTNASGQASSTLTLGDKVGTYTVAATSTGLTGSPVTFSATAMAPSYPPMLSVNTSISFPSRSNPSDYTASDYRIIGLPGASNVSVASFLSGSQGTDWELYWDNGEPSNYLVKYDGGSDFVFSAGRAFWLIKKGPWSLTTAVTSAPLNVSREVEVALHAGWNLICNPFTSPIAWSKMQSVNSVQEPIWAFDGSFTQTSSFDPYVGYYFYNTTALPVLRVPYDSIFSAAVAIGDGDRSSWRVNVVLSSGGFLDKATSFGVSGKASRELDRLDFRKPRTIGAVPGVYFHRPEWDAEYSTFATDIRPAVKKAEGWAFEVYSSKREPSELSFSGIADIPSHFEVYLIDEGKAMYINLRDDSLCSFTSSTNISKFSVIVGKEEVVREILSSVHPKEFALGVNYPNPFNPSTTISVDVPIVSEIAVTIYDILGQEVRTVYAGTLEPGRHWISWDGRDETHRDVCSGAYLYRLTTATGVNLVRKMILVR